MARERKESRALRRRKRELSRTSRAFARPAGHTPFGPLRPLARSAHTARAHEVFPQRSIISVRLRSRSFRGEIRSFLRDFGSFRRTLGSFQRSLRSSQRALESLHRALGGANFREMLIPAIAGFVPPRGGFIPPRAGIISPARRPYLSVRRNLFSDRCGNPISRKFYPKTQFQPKKPR